MAGLRIFLVLSLIIPISLQAAFTAGPDVAYDGSSATITFTVDASTDAEVAVLDNNGKVIRHLAAGVLGGQYAPPAPLTQGLSQSLVWDMTDDRGIPAANGPFKVRVRLGLSPEYDFTINTRTIPGSHLQTYTVPKMWEETVILTNPIFYRILTLHSNPDLFMQVNKAYNEVYIHVTNTYSTDQHRFSGEDGSPLGIVSFGTAHERQYWGEIAFTPNGESIIHTTSLENIYRYTRLGQPESWPGGSVSEVTGLQQGFTNARGHAIGPDGSCYVLHHHDHCGGIYVGDSTYKGGVVTKLSPAGAKEKVEFIKLGTYVGGGIGVDPAGNIFVGAAVKPAGKAVPDGVAALAPNTGSESLGWWAEQMYGSVVKYTPAGTKVWEYFGQSPVSLSKPNPPRGTHCICNVSRFDVDGCGRVFLPDAFRVSVVAIDNNRNEIMRVNHKLMLEQSKLPFAWPHAIEVTDNAIFVGDQVNDQVICLKLAYETEAEAPVSIETAAGLSAAVPFSILPNPITRTASVRLHLKQGGPVHLALYSVDGRKITDLFAGYLSRGPQTLSWTPEHRVSGVVIARLTLDGRVHHRRLLVMR